MGPDDGMLHSIYDHQRHYLSNSNGNHFQTIGAFSQSIYCWTSRRYTCCGMTPVAPIGATETGD